MQGVTKLTKIASPTPSNRTQAGIASLSLRLPTRPSPRHYHYRWGRARWRSLRLVASLNKESNGQEDGGEKSGMVVAKIEDSPSLDGGPPSPPDSSSETSTDSDGDDRWPSFVPEAMRLNRGDLWTVALAFGISYAVRWGVAEPRFIPSLSMYPFFDIGDRLIAEKITYRFLRPPERGDVVIFRPVPGITPKRLFGEDVFIKRIVGLEGDRIEVKDGALYVNGMRRNEPFLSEAPDYVLEETAVPAGNIFVMGDNRNNSYDSHLWGPLPAENVIGRACFIYWPFSKLGTLPDYSMYEAPPLTTQQ